MGIQPFLIAAFLALVLASPAHAQTDDPIPTLGQCEARFDTCMSACSAANPASSAGLAGCQARCAANRAACEAKAGYEKAKPWVQEQFEAMEDFFEGFREGGGERGPAAPEAPPPAQPVPRSDGAQSDEAPYKDL